MSTMIDSEEAAETQGEWMSVVTRWKVRTKGSQRLLPYYPEQTPYLGIR